MMNITSKKLCFVLTIVGFTNVVSAKGLDVKVDRVGSASQIEFQGSRLWDYQTSRSGNEIRIRIEKVDPESIAQLKSWKDDYIEKIEVKDVDDKSSDIIVTVKSGKVSMFDYQMESPSRLFMDFFDENEDKNKTPVAETKVEKAAPAKTAKAQVAKKLPKKGEASRKPASTEMIQDPALAGNANSSENNENEKVGKASGQGLFDGGDPDYDRFRIQPFEISEDAQIASLRNVYIHFPFLMSENSFFEELQKNAPIYQVENKASDENKQVRLLKTIFENKRYALFLKGLGIFRKDFPKTSYEHMLSYMEADAFFALWKESDDQNYFKKAINLYTRNLKDYPDSPLASRTKLFIAYAQLDKGDNFAALKEFLGLIDRDPNGIFRYDLELSVGDSLLAANQFEDAIDKYKQVNAKAPDEKVKARALYKIGDAYAKQNKYNEAIEAYKTALAKSSKYEHEFPGAYYNTAESFFWKKDYLQALDQYVSFLKKYPLHPFGGYALDRVGEIAEIMTKNTEKIQGAYLENMFRFNNTTGAFVSKVRLTTARFEEMKNNDVLNLVKEIKDFIQKENSPEVEHFATIMLEDGFYRRKDYDKSFDLLVNYFQNNQNSPYIDLYKKRIVRNLTAQVKGLYENGNDLKALQLYGKYSGTWLKNADRLDLRYAVAKAYERTGVPQEAIKVYNAVINQLYAIQGTQELKEKKLFEEVPSIESLNLRLAKSYFDNGQFDDALTKLKNISDVKQLNEEEHLERSMLYADIALRQSNQPVAVEFLSDLVDSWKGKPELVIKPYNKLIGLYYENKEYDKADQVVQKIMHFYEDSKSITPEEYAGALEWKGNIQLAQGQRDEAIQSYSELIDKYDPEKKMASLRYKLGLLLFDKGDMTRAEQYWTTLQANKSGEIWYKLAKEKLDNAKWTDTYKKYLNRLPASQKE